MVKQRIPFDVDEGLKNSFSVRLEKQGKGHSVTEALKSAMYQMMLMDDETLETFIDFGIDLEAIHTIFRGSLPQYKEYGILHNDYIPGTPEDFKRAGMCIHKLQEIKQEEFRKFYKNLHKEEKSKS